MALKLSHSENTGAIWPNAYHRIAAIRLDYTLKQGLVELLIYKDAQARLDGKSPVEVRYLTVSNFLNEETGVPVTHFDNRFAHAKLDTMNPIKSAYEHLLTLPEYTGAVSV